MTPDDIALAQKILEGHAHYIQKHIYRVMGLKADVTVHIEPLAGPKITAGARYA